MTSVGRSWVLAVACIISVSVMGCPPQTGTPSDETGLDAPNTTGGDCENDPSLCEAFCPEASGEVLFRGVFTFSAPGPATFRPSAGQTVTVTALSNSSLSELSITVSRAGQPVVAGSDDRDVTVSFVADSSDVYEVVTTDALGDPTRDVCILVTQP